MKIHCTKADLHRGVQTIQSALSPRTTLPILLNFLMETENSRLKLVSTDLQMGMKHYIPAEIESTGSITIPARKFYDIIQSLQDDKEVDLAVDAGGRIQVKSGRSRFSIAGSPKSEYPVIPDFNEENSFTVSSIEMEEMVRKTVFAASTDETRHMLNGVFWVASGGTLDMVATDGRRLAIIKRTCIPKDKEFRIIIPTKILTELLRLLNSIDNKKESGDEIKVGVTENQIAFQHKTTTLMSRLVEGNFPNYEQVIPTRRDIRVEMGTQALLAITKRAALCAMDRGGSVRYTIKSGSLQVSASSQNLEFDDEMPLEYEGTEMAVAFNPQFIVEGIKNIDTERISLSLTTATNPALIESAGDTTYQYVVMPMRV